LRVKTIVFDLDDTLYSEIDYVHSGFRAVSDFFALNHKLEGELLYAKMLQELELHGRGSVFNNTFEHFGIHTKNAVKKAISLYRLHAPNVTLPKESIEILDYFKKQNIPLYLVTDGNKIVQANKIKALGLEKFISKSFITHRYGKIHAKPSSYCFLKIAKLENTAFSEIVYIADNINKDFVGIKQLGFQTVRICQGMFQDAQKPQEFHAHAEIQSLLELKNLLKVK
jgi:putative hydrolase of the HAD superfamily